MLNPSEFIWQAHLPHANRNRLGGVQTQVLLAAATEGEQGVGTGSAEGESGPPRTSAGGSHQRWRAEAS